MSVSRTSDRHTTHSALLSLISSSATCRLKKNTWVLERTRFSRCLIDFSNLSCRFRNTQGEADWKVFHVVSDIYLWFLAVVFVLYPIDLLQEIAHAIHLEKKNMVKNRGSGVPWETDLKCVSVYERHKNETQRGEGSERRKECSPLVSASEASHSSSHPYADKGTNSWINLSQINWNVSPAFNWTKSRVSFTFSNVASSMWEWPKCSTRIKKKS